MKDSHSKSPNMKKWYKDLENRYTDFPESVQILNLVSDLEKVRHFWNTDITSARNHLFRAIILIDYITEDPKWSGKLKEVRRLREVVGSLIENNRPLATPQETIKAALFLNSQAYSRLNQMEDKIFKSERTEKKL